MPVLSTIVPPPWSRKSASFAARVSKISARSMVMSNAYSAPGHHRQQRLVDRDDAQVVGGDGAEDGVDDRHEHFLSIAARVTVVTCSL